MLSWLDREDYNPQRFEPLRVDQTAYGEPKPRTKTEKPVGEQAEWELEKLFDTYDSDDGWGRDERWTRNSRRVYVNVDKPGVSRPKLKIADQEDFPIV